MLDTTTINYAIEKVSQIFEKIGCEGYNVLEKLVIYNLFRVKFEFIISLILLIISVILEISILRYGKKVEYDTIPYVILITIFSIISIVAIPSFFYNLYNIILLYNNPEVYTIMQLLSKG